MPKHHALRRRAEDLILALRNIPCGFLKILEGQKLLSHMLSPAARVMGPREDASLVPCHTGHLFHISYDYN